MPVWQARQLSFDTAKLIADKGGVIGLWPMRSDVGATPEAYAQRLWSWPSGSATITPASAPT